MGVWVIVICPPPAKRPESIRVIASRPGLILCCLHRACYTCSSTRCLLHFICMYITVYMCLFNCPVLTLFHAILFTKGLLLQNMVYFVFLWLICIVLLILIAFLPDVLVRNDEINMFNQSIHTPNIKRLVNGLWLFHPHSRCPSL